MKALDCTSWLFVLKNHPEFSNVRQQTFYYACGFSGSGVWKRDDIEGLTLLSNVWGLSWEDCKAGVALRNRGWNHLKACLFEYLVPGQGERQTGAANQSASAWSLQVVWLLNSMVTSVYMLAQESNARVLDNRVQMGSPFLT